MEFEVQKFGRSQDDAAGMVKLSEQALEMQSRICDLAEDPKIGAEGKGEMARPARILECGPAGCWTARLSGWQNLPDCR